MPNKEAQNHELTVQQIPKPTEPTEEREERIFDQLQPDVRIQYLVKRIQYLEEFVDNEV